MFLSSGVDSSYVASQFKGQKSFTVGFDYDKYNEIEYAKELSKEVIKISGYNGPKSIKLKSLSIL